MAPMFPENTTVMSTETNDTAAEKAVPEHEE